MLSYNTHTVVHFSPGILKTFAVSQLLWHFRNDFSDVGSDIVIEMDFFYHLYFALLCSDSFKL